MPLCLDVGRCRGRWIVETSIGVVLLPDHRWIITLEIHVFRSVHPLQLEVTLNSWRWRINIYPVHVRAAFF